MNSQVSSLERYRKKLTVMLSLADNLRALSTDPEVQFGCVIFSTDCSSIEAIGYNGMPAGIDTLDRGPLDTVGGTGFCHAELNALTKWNTRSAGPCLLFVHRTPCMRCAGQIINSRKIVGVIHEDPYVDGGAGLQLIKRAGIRTMHREELDGPLGDTPLYDWKTYASRKGFV